MPVVETDIHLLKPNAGLKGVIRGHFGGFVSEVRSHAAVLNMRLLMFDGPMLTYTCMELDHGFWSDDIARRVSCYFARCEVIVTQTNHQ